jgi:outer membrane protein OmpA-like peptidoglycan-associated protein/tetratricopeptide (TPR) repeat protein
MEKLYKLALLLLAILIVNTGTYAQGKAEKKLLKKARKQLSLGEYIDAKKSYNELLNMDKTNKEYYFEAGLAYYNSGVEKEKSVDYFENCLKNSQQDTIGEVFYYLGRSYQFVERFEDAITQYKNFKEFVKSNKQGAFLNRDVNRYLQMCNSGKQFAGTKNENINVYNLGPSVNTTYPEYAPVVDKAQNILLFTGRKSGSTGNKFYHDNHKYEDIYVSARANNDEEWSTATKVDSSNSYFSGKINSKWHDAAIGYSEDETKLYIYRKNDVWESEINNGKWKDPVKMNKNINTKGHEPSVFLTPTEDLLFLVSDRKEGVGGRDIYMSKKEADGSWGPVENLSILNTEFDEDAPFLADDTTLFFSSNGHNTMGGYDVFKSMKRNGKWGKPENVGMPINSPGDDIYYIQDKEAETGYYSSSKADGFGAMDLYHIQLMCKNIPNTEVRGLILAGNQQTPVGGKITVTNKKSGEEVGTFTADSETGKYLMVLPPDNTYSLTLDVDRKPWNEAGRPHQEEFTIPRQCEFFQLYQEVQIRHVYKDKDKKQMAQEAIFHNAMHDVKTQAQDLYKLPNIDDKLNPMSEDDTTLVNLASTMMHNDVLPATNVEVMLVNDKNEIISTTSTDKTGFFRFHNVKAANNYKILVSESGVRRSYYGSDADPKNSVIIKGLIEKETKAGNLPASNFEVNLVSDDKKVVNLATSDEAGNYTVDNLPDTPVNDTRTFAYNIQVTDADRIYSAYLRTVDTTTTNDETHFSEYIDIIDLKGPVTPEFADILFDFDKYFLRDKSESVLSKIYDYMAANPDVTITMGGHTDWKGTDAYNMKLSERRVNAALKYLKNKGIDPSRMKKEWFGEAKPAVSNAYPDGTDNPENRQLNRRVELRISIPDTAELVISL